MKVVILGAGPTGLSAAWRLQEHGHNDWLLLESSDRGARAGRYRAAMSGGRLTRPRQDTAHDVRVEERGLQVRPVEGVDAHEPLRIGDRQALRAGNGSCSGCGGKSGHPSCEDIGSEAAGSMK